MRKHIILSIAVSLLWGGCSFTGKKSENMDKRLIEYVDPFIGTAGHGHTFPGNAVPFGMVQVSPDTGLEGWDWCSGYHYSDSSIIGFSHTHLSGTGRSDLMDVLIMPFIFLLADKDDAPGAILMGLVPIFVSAVIAVFAAVLQRLLQEAVDIKAESDLTI